MVGAAPASALHGWLEVSVGVAGRWSLVHAAPLPLTKELVIGRALLGGDPGVGGQHLVVDSAGERLRVRVDTRRPTAIFDGDRLRPLPSGSTTELQPAQLRADGVRLALGPRILKLAANDEGPGSGIAIRSDIEVPLPDTAPAMDLAQAVITIVTAPVSRVQDVARRVCQRALGATLSTAPKPPPASWWTFSAPAGKGAVVIERDPSRPPFDEEERRVCEQVAVALQRAAPEASAQRRPSSDRGDEGDDPSRQVLRWFDDYLGGASPAVVAFHEDLAHIAADIGRRLGDGSEAPILLLSGEPGVGKDRAAGALHAVFKRLHGRPGALVSVNLAAIPDTLAEAELFGIVSSAATGVKERPGALERARGGTIFLNEVDKCPLPLQAKLLTVLEARKVTRVGGGEERDVDAVIVAANNGRMPDLVRDGVVIQPLADRLGVPLEVPSLAERGREDLELYATTFLAARGVGPPRAAAMIAVLADLPWPGNVRQLKNVVERVCQLGRTDRQGITRIHALTMPTPKERDVPRPVSPEAEPRYRALFERWQALGRSDAALAAESEVDERTVRNWKKRWRELGLST